MANLNKYRVCIENLIKEYGCFPEEDGIESQLIFDREHDHYQLNNVGWQANTRICGPVLHFDIKNDKIWIQHNGTEFDIADELMAMGVSKEDIVIGFQPPYKRKYTGFAVE
jgi:hypothetical protein